jgi:hypothetical protein
MHEPRYYMQQRSMQSRGKLETDTGRCFLTMHAGLYSYISRSNAEEVISLTSEWQNVTKQRFTNTNPIPNTNSNHNPNILNLLQVCF